MSILAEKIGLVKECANKIYLHLSERAMVRKQFSMTLAIAEREKAQIEQLMLAFGQTWGDSANVSKLIKVIAFGYGGCDRLQFKAARPAGRL